MKQVIYLVVLGLVVVACASASPPAPAATAIPEPDATSLPSPTPLETTTTIPPTETVDMCAGATLPGARERFSFEQIVPCLDSPQKVVDFMRANLAWDPAFDNKTYGDNAYSPAWEVYQAGMDDCDGMAEFAACVLSSHGYEAYNVGITILSPSGHNVTGFIDEDGLYYGINNGGAIDGPFESWEDLAQLYIDRGYAAPGGVLWLFEPCIAQRAVGEPVIALPHTVIR